MIKRIFSLVALIGAIIVPLSASAASYLIERGDTLTSIAREFGVSVRDIAIQNDIKDVNKIYAGATLEINSANTDEGVDGDVLGGPGGAYTPVTGYQSRITTYISSAATTVPVASTKDKAGNQIVLADISSSSTAKVYLSLATGTSKEEIIACTGLTSASWTGCSRGLSFQGGSMTASTTIAYAHNAGESVIITDVGQFFNEFVSVSGNQTIFDRKTFYAFPIVTSTTALPTLGSELASKYYVDSVGAGGFTSLNASTTRGLSVDGSAPERVGINASTTKGLAFDNNGTSNWPLYIAASSTGGINFSSAGTIQVDGSDNFAFSGSNIFSGAVTSTGSFRVTTAPTSANDVLNLSYYQNQSNGFTATSTAASAITAGKALFITSTSTLNMTDTGSGTSTFFFVGFATANTSAAAEVTYTRPGGINCSQSGLTPGAYYYLNGASGAISTLSPVTYQARVGLALTATCIQALQPKYKYTNSYGTTAAANGSTSYQNTFFYPARIAASMGPAVDATYTYSSFTMDTEAGAVGTNVVGTSIPAARANSIYIEDEGGSCYWSGDVTKSSNGFTVTNNNYRGGGCGNMVNVDIRYTVSNE